MIIQQSINKKIKCANTLPHTTPNKLPTPHLPQVPLCSLRFYPHHRISRWSYFFSAVAAITIKQCTIRIQRSHPQTDLVKRRGNFGWNAWPHFIVAILSITFDKRHALTLLTNFWRRLWAPRFDGLPTQPVGSDLYYARSATKLYITNKTILLTTPTTANASNLRTNLQQYTHTLMTCTRRKFNRQKSPKPQVWKIRKKKKLYMTRKCELWSILEENSCGTLPKFDRRKNYMCEQQPNNPKSVYTKYSFISIKLY